MEYKISYREKDKSVQCIISYKDNYGIWRTKSKQGFKNQKESKKWQSKTLKDLEEDLKNELYLNMDYRDITFAQFKEMFLEDLSIIYAYNTVRVRTNSLKLFSMLDDSLLAEITFLDLKKAINNIIKKGYKNNTIKMAVSSIKLLFDSAKEEYRIIHTSPLSEGTIKLPEDKSADEIKTLSKHDLDTLINTITPVRDKIIIILGSKCGLRAGEIAGLTWDNVDFENSCITINKQWKRKEESVYGFGTTKSKNSNRVIPINDFVIQELKAHKKSMEIDFKTNRVVPEKNTNGMGSRVNVKIKRLGFDNSIHDLRHTYATNLIAMGLDFKTVSAFMGDTVEMVMKTYSHFTEEMYEAGKQKIEKYL